MTALCENDKMCFWAELSACKDYQSISWSKAECNGGTEGQRYKGWSSFYTPHIITGSQDHASPVPVYSQPYLLCVCPALCSIPRPFPNQHGEHKSSQKTRGKMKGLRQKDNSENSTESQNNRIVELVFVVGRDLWVHLVPVPGQPCALLCAPSQQNCSRPSMSLPRTLPSTPISPVLGTLAQTDQCKCWICISECFRSHKSIS